MTLNNTPTPPPVEAAPIPSDFKVGDYVQRVGVSDSAIYKIHHVHPQPVPYGVEGQAWEYDAEEVYGAHTGDFYPRVVIGGTNYHTVTDPDVVNTLKLTKQQRQIFDAATVLLHHLENNLPENTIHWMVETLKIDLGKVVNTGHGKHYAARTAYVGNWPTTDSKEN